MRFFMPFRSALTAALALTLAACGGAPESDGNGHAAGHHENASGGNMASAANPFAAGDMRMHDRMMAASGRDVSEMWIRKMIEHHRGALDMSRVLLDQGGTPDVRQMAQATIDSQGAEIEQLQQMLERRGLPRQPD